MSEDTQPMAFVGNTDELTAAQNLAAATSLIDYRSAGNCLIIGPAEHALAVSERLHTLSITVVTIDPGTARTEKALTESGIAVFTVAALALDGYLGAFRAVAVSANDELDLAVSVYLESGAFDLVLDLSAMPMMDARLPPFGYCHARSPDELEQALTDLPQLVGDFEKPRYFDYDAAICAHRRSEITACTQCIDVCATGAIQTDGDGVTVNPHLCQGCGSCASTCPSGAMRYAYPRPRDAISRTRDMLRGNADAYCILLHAEDQQERVEAANLATGILPLLVEEVTAFGIDYWLSLIASGVHRIIIVADNVTDVDRQSLLRQVRLLDELLAGVGVSDSVVQIVHSDMLTDGRFEVAKIEALRHIQPAGFATHNNKRQTVRLAMDSLSEQLSTSSPVIALSAGSPFGTISVDTSACTLCMACVSVCPGKALQDGQDVPALRIVETNCLQCGLCEQACPEQAIGLEARYVVDSLEARRLRTLNEEEPFHCVSCHKAFATRGLIDTMLGKLDGHWMFQDERSLRRLKMCDDCRVRDIFEADRAGIAVHREPEA